MLTVLVYLSWVSASPLFIKPVETAYTTSTYLRGKNVSDAAAKTFERCISFGKD